MAVLRLLPLLAAVYALGIAEPTSDHSVVPIAFQEDSDFDDVDKIAEKIVQTRAIDGSENEAQQSDGKFKIYVGTIDGVRREIYNEVEGEGNNAPDNIPNPADPFSAYDDNTIIDTEDEKNLFVPKPYRPGSKEKSTTTTRPHITAPPTTIRTIPFVQTTPAPRQPISLVQQNRQPTPAAPPRVVPTAPPRTVQQNQFRQPAPAVPPRVAPPLPPRQPLPVQPQVAQQPHLPQQPQPLRPRTRRPPIRPPTPAPFQPQQQNFNVQQSLQTPPPQVQQPFQNRQPPFVPQQPQFQTPRSQQFPQQFQTPPPTTPAPQLPFAGQQNLRTGVCPMSIFYISTPISGPTRLSFTHFAIAVTVDQCARTCHEFNCAIAHYNPSNGHCEFNPSTAFAIRNGQCPAWPSLHYRNNVVASEPVRIFCVTCQRPRRRQNRQRNIGLRQRAKDPRQVPNGRRGSIRSHRNTRITLNRISSHPVIHGVLVRQPKAIALGVSQMSFNSPIESKTHEIAVGVSPTLYEDGGDSSTFQETRRSSGSGNKLFGMPTYQRSSSDDVNSQSSLVATQ